MQTKTIDGQTFIKMVSGGAANLRANASIVNDLNVFPIPDGDTGENMSRTINGGLSRLDIHDGLTLDKASRMLADGMLMSARGNSGVILSQFFAGIAKGFEGKENADLDDLANALKSGVESAYAAVNKPTEGTILTVAREAAEYAASRITADSTFASFANDYINEMNASLRRTPELLDVLKEAGVIDSGGAGLYYIADGAIKAANGENFITSVSPDENAPKTIDTNGFDENSVMKFGYCTEFLLQLQTCKTDVKNFGLDKLKAYLETVGDSIVAFISGTVVKVHVHTMTPGTVLDYCQQYGEFLTLKIENMTLQHSKTVISNRFDEKREDKKKAEKKPYALVTTASGEGIEQTFTELGADYVIYGGQTNNPSTEDFISAFDEVNAKTIFVLPNNSNIIMAAKQAAELYKDSDVRVVPSHNIGEGYAALTMLSYDSGDTDAIAGELEEAMQGVITGMITHSVRNADIDGVSIDKDAYIGFTDKKMLASDGNKIDTAMLLLEKLNAKSHEFLMAVFGKEMTDSEREEFTARMSAEYPMMEVYTIDGGQEVYDLMLILQ
ncbi:MAG: DAK2 domain-containing protein [Ruminiclostridium sp.]|nr:DAK2 domain-containing protein [Ruminiclostridium sp.]